MRASGLGLAALLGLTACSDEALVVTASLPEDTRYLATVLTSGDGRSVVASPLLERKPGQAIQIQAHIVEGEIAGAQLHAYAGELSDETWALRDDRPVSPAAPGDPVLPNAHWLGEGPRSDDHVPVHQVAELPPLTAPWLARCPTLIEPGAELAIDQRCVPRPCAPQPRQSDCILEHDLVGCALEAVRFRVDGVGKLEPDNPYTIQHCRGVEGPADLSYQCDDCRVDLYRRPAEPPPAPFELERLTLEAITVENGSDEGPFDGAVADLLLDGDRAVVASYAGEMSAKACQGGGNKSRFFFLDVASFQRVASATVAGCHERLAADPVGGGFFSLSRDTRGIWLNRFSRAGVLQETRNLNLPSNHVPSALFSSKTPPRLAIGTRAAADGRFFLLDPATLDPIATRAEGSKLYALTAGEAGLLLLGYRAFIDFVALEDGAYDSAINIGTGSGVGNQAQVITYLPRLQRYLSIDSSEVSGVYMATRVEGVITFTAHYAPRATLSSASAWPLDEKLALVGMMAFDDQRALLSLFEVESVRFLPDSWEIGYGPVTALHEDGAGRLWLLLPWTGELLRLSPRP